MVWILGWESRIDDIANERKARNVRIYHEVPSWVDALDQWWDARPRLWELEREITGEDPKGVKRVNYDVAVCCLDFACRAYWYRKLKAPMPVILFRLVHAASLGIDLIADSRGYASLPTVLEVVGRFGLPIHTDEKASIVRSVIGQTGYIKGLFRRIFELYRDVVDVINVKPCLIRVRSIEDLRRLVKAGIPVAIGSKVGYYGRIVDGKSMLVPGRDVSTISTIVGWEDDSKLGMLYYRVFADSKTNYASDGDGYPSGGWIEEYRVADEIPGGSVYGVLILAEPHSVDEISRLWFAENRSQT